MASAVNEEKSKMYEAILSSPGMMQKCKINLQISRQNVLLLSRLIEANLLTKKHSFDDGIIGALAGQSAEEFRIIHEEILKKAELSDFYEKLKAL